jgi:hypothetical protein
MGPPFLRLMGTGMMKRRRRRSLGETTKVSVCVGV